MAYSASLGMLGNSLKMTETLRSFNSFGEATLNVRNCKGKAAAALKPSCGKDPTGEYQNQATFGNKDKLKLHFLTARTFPSSNG